MSDTLSMIFGIFLIMFVWAFPAAMIGGLISAEHESLKRQHLRSSQNGNVLSTYGHCGNVPCGPSTYRSY